MPFTANLPTKCHLGGPPTPHHTPSLNMNFPEILKIFGGLRPQNAKIFSPYRASFAIFIDILLHFLSNTGQKDPNFGACRRLVTYVDVSDIANYDLSTIIILMYINHLPRSAKIFSIFGSKMIVFTSGNAIF